jgi:hypothetical protein
MEWAPATLCKASCASATRFHPWRSTWLPTCGNLTSSIIVPISGHDIFISYVGSGSDFLETGTRVKKLKNSSAQLSLHLKVKNTFPPYEINNFIYLLNYFIHTDAVLLI